MNGTALYRALIEAGAGEERAKEATESVVYAPEAATKSDIAAVRSEIVETRGELLARISALESTMERTFRMMTLRLAGVFLGVQALFLAALRLTGSA